MEHQIQESVVHYILEKALRQKTENSQILSKIRQKREELQVQYMKGIQMLAIAEASCLTNMFLAKNDEKEWSQ